MAITVVKNMNSCEEGYDGCKKLNSCEEGYNIILLTILDYFFLF